MAVSAEIKEITPAIAQKILDANTSNRNVRKSRVATYARDMEMGRWRLNGDSISMNGKGKLYNGQHRLLACILANSPFKTVVVTGLQDDVHSTIDTGLNRTLADELRWRGEENAAPLGAILSLLWHYDRGDNESIVPSRADLISYLDKHPTIRASLPRMSIRTYGVRGTAFAATHFLIAREHGLDVADAFADEVARGTGYVEGDPALALRNYALGASATRLTRPTTPEWFAICIKAANYWLMGRPTKHLKWRRVGPGKEAFPTLITSEMAGA